MTSQVQGYLDIVFLVAFVLEALIAIRVMGLKSYWGVAWHKIDVTIIATAVCYICRYQVISSSKENRVCCCEYQEFLVFD